MAVVDIQGFVVGLKAHLVEHGFHIHDERHFIETYTNRQTWEIDLHPEDACGGPLDMNIALEVDPRSLIALEDDFIRCEETGEPSQQILVPLHIGFVLPPLPYAPDLLILSTDLAGVGSTELPLQVSALDSIVEVTDAPVRTISIGALIEVDLATIFTGTDGLCDLLDRCANVAEFLLDRAPAWIGEL